jgi:non-specific protein-tyrosine kinase
MNLVTLNQPASAAAEAYRTLRTNLHFAALEKPIKTLLIATPDANTSATAVLANLAVALAQSEKRVIAVDANLREPSLHALFDLPNGPGLADVLANSNGASDPQLRATSVPGLSVVTGGAAPTIANDAISSKRMRAVIDKLSGLTDVDIVLFAAPPLTAYSDGAVLASEVDGTLLVVGAGKTRRENAQKAKDILERAHARLVGAVLLNAK